MFIKWLAELFHRSVWLMTSTIVALGLSTVLTVGGQSIPAIGSHSIVIIALLIIAAITFFFANFYVWRDKQQAWIRAEQAREEAEQARDEAKRELEALQLPQLSGTIEQIIFGDSEGGAQGFILLAIKNTGALSIVQGYHLTIDFGSGKKTYTPVLIPEGFKLVSPDGEASLSSKDAIYEKTVLPVGRGDLRRGWLRYVFPGILASQLRVPGTKWSVEFSDVRDRKFSATYVINGEMSTPMYFPGAEQPFAKLMPKPTTEVSGPASASSSASGEDAVSRDQHEPHGP